MLHFITRLHSKAKALFDLPILFAVILIFFSIIRVPTDELRLSMRLFFELALGVILCVWLWRENKWVAMFMGLATFSVLFPLPLGIRGYISFFAKGGDIWRSFLAYNAVLYGVIWYAIFLRIEPVKMHIIYNAICIIALINVGWLILQYFGIDPMFHAKHDPTNRSLPVALMGNRNLASGLLAICLPAFFRKYWCAMIPLVIWGIMVSKSFNGITSAAVAVCVFGALNGYKFLPLFVCSGAMVIYWFCIDDTSLAARYKPWQFALKLYKQHWIFGSGIGGWQEIGKLNRPECFNRPYKTLHNDILQAVFEMGIGAGIIIIGYFVNIAKRSKSFFMVKKQAIIPLSGLAAVVSNAMYSFPLHIGTTAMIAITWMALLEVSLRET